MAASKTHPNGKPKKTRRKPAEAKAKKMSALDAAAQVLAETGQPMACKEMIEAMAQKGYWSSPGGKTPASTLYSGMRQPFDGEIVVLRQGKPDFGLLLSRNQTYSGRPDGPICIRLTHP
jgi:hypothetical protein